MNDDAMGRLIKRVIEDDRRRPSLLAIGWAEFQKHGFGAVLVESDPSSPFVREARKHGGDNTIGAHFVPARELHKFLDKGTMLDGALKYCALYDPQKSIVLVCFGPNDKGAAVTIATDPQLTPLAAYEAGHLPTARRD